MMGATGWMVVAPMPMGAVATAAALLGGYFLLAGVPWGLGATVHPPRGVDRTRRHRVDAAGHAAMSVGMGVFMLVMR
jgi:hypothetical protein